MSIAGDIQIIQKQSGILPLFSMKRVGEYM